MTLFTYRRINIITYSLIIILIDQISKFLVLNNIGFDKSRNIIPNILNFTLVKNKGAAFSLFSSATTILTFISIFATLLLVTLILKFPPKSYWNSMGTTYLLGGTVGNGIDRIFNGYVLDFFELLPIKFAIFNIADISINIAIVCFIIDLYSSKRKSIKTKKWLIHEKKEFQKYNILYTCNFT